MADKLSDLDAGEDTAVGPDREATTGTSGWQKVVGILGLVVVLWVGSMMYDFVFFDGSGSGADTPAVNQGPDGGGGHRPPAGGH